MAATLRVGTCSFADESLSRYWYPRGIRTGEERLRAYAGCFDVVEIDSTYYTLPSAENARRWVERTPPGFVFHVKAFGMMTRHPVRLEQLPPDLRPEVEADARGRVVRPGDGVRAEVFARFRDGIEPLRAAGRLGGVLLQLPPYVVPRPEAFAYVAWARERLPAEELLVEFRHRDWVEGAMRERTLSLLAELGATFVVVDAPRSQARNVLPTVVATTSDTAYVRMHGRNAATWNKRGGSAAERFDYLYSDGELREWVAPLRRLAEASERAYVLFNNNGRSPAGPASGEREWIAQAPTNAVMLRRILKQAGLPVSDPSSFG